MSPGIPLAAIVLAAGGSTRMQGRNKLLLPWGKHCVVQQVVSNLCTLGLAEVVVVTGHQRAEVDAALKDAPARQVHNPAYGGGMATSIVAGIAAAGPARGYLLVLGDMPSVSMDTVRKVCAALVDERTIALPTYGNRRGHPVAIGAAYRDELLALRGDTGARAVLRAHAERVVEVEVEDAGVLVDVDTPEAYREAVAQRAAATQQ